MDLIEIIGYIAALLMFSTFYMKKMIPLRIAGMSSNVFFAIFAGFTGVWPLLILHICLFPLNFLRMIQMLKLVNKVKQASKGDMSMEFLVPFMQKTNFKAGDVVFKAGDQADKMYFVREGEARLVELDVKLGPGEVIGEMGIFAGDNERMATLECVTDTEFLCIGDKAMLQLYYQNPEFGFYLVQLIIKRFKSNMRMGALSKAVINGERA